MPGDLNGVLPGHLDGVLPGHLDGVLPGHLDGVLPGHLDGVLPGYLRFCPGTWMGFSVPEHRSGYGVLPRHMDGGIGILLASMCFAHTWMEHLPHAGAN